MAAFLQWIGSTLIQRAAALPVDPPHLRESGAKDWQRRDRPIGSVTG